MLGAVVRNEPDIVGMFTKLVDRMRVGASWRPLAIIPPRFAEVGDTYADIVRPPSRTWPPSPFHWIRTVCDPGASDGRTKVWERAPRRPPLPASAKRTSERTLPSTIARAKRRPASACASALNVTASGPATLVANEPESPGMSVYDLTLAPRIVSLMVGVPNPTTSRVAPTVWEAELTLSVRSRICAVVPRAVNQSISTVCAPALTFFRTNVKDRVPSKFSVLNLNLTSDGWAGTRSTSARTRTVVVEYISAVNVISRLSPARE